MRNTGPFTQYNRAIVRRVAKEFTGETDHIGLDKSLLGAFGAGEARFLVSFVAWADADRTTYQ